MARRRLLVTAVVAAALLLLSSSVFAAPARAHSELIGWQVSPAQGTAGPVLVLRFSEVLDPRFVQVEVFDRAGTQIAPAPTKLDPSLLVVRVSLPASVPDATYRGSWWVRARRRGHLSEQLRLRPRRCRGPAGAPSRARRARSGRHPSHVAQPDRRRQPDPLGRPRGSHAGHGRPVVRPGRLETHTARPAEARPGRGPGRAGRPRQPVPARPARTIPGGRPTAGVQQPAAPGLPGEPDSTGAAAAGRPVAAPADLYLASLPSGPRGGRRPAAGDQVRLDLDRTRAAGDPPVGAGTPPRPAGTRAVAPVGGAQRRRPACC